MGQTFFIEQGKSLRDEGIVRVERTKGTTQVINLLGAGKSKATANISLYQEEEPVVPQFESTLTIAGITGKCVGFSSSRIAMEGEGNAVVELWKLSYSLEITVS